MSEPVKKGQKYQNRETFKAHRNMKRAVRDVDKESALKNQACAGVCRRCAQKVRGTNVNLVESKQRMLP
jgi:hypothetical protein|tara:strand:+ start:1183 stop:1389 length:207 start_codon:yes stop_codon:yes gene_type:complete